MIKRMASAKVEQIKSLLRDGLLTQKQISERVECTQGYVSRVKYSLTGPVNQYSLLRAEVASLRHEVAKIRELLRPLSNIT